MRPIPRRKLRHRQRARLWTAPLGLAAAATMLWSGAASAQILGPLSRPLPSVAAPLRGAATSLGGRVEGALGGVEGLGRDLRPERLLGLRLERLERLVRANRRVLELRGSGEVVVRGQVLAVAPSERGLAAARQAGFSVSETTQLEGLELEVALLSAPAGLPTGEAVRLLRSLDPGGVYEFNHLYAGAGDVGVAKTAALASAAPAGQTAGAGARLGLVDSGVDADHPVFAGMQIEQRPFAPGGLAPAAHGTAVASIAAGRAAGFRGAAPGATLLVADVYGRGPTGGSTDAVLRALAWLGARQTPVINISLVGPPNAALQAAVSALRKRGVLIVAPVGNDGPAAPPLFPASYPEVVAVTGVDARGKVLLEAGRARKLDFAAPGAGVAAAKLGRGFGPVRGTSFASPIVAARLALLVPAPSPGAAEHALAALERTAKPGGPYGRGLVGSELHLAAKP